VTVQREDLYQGTAVAEVAGKMVPVRIVDCDVHPQLRSGDDLLPFLPSRWAHIARKDPPLPWRINMINDARRVDSWPESGGPPGSDPAFMDKQLLGDAKVDIAILVPIEFGPMIDPRADAARHAAANQWLAETWLGDANWHGRYRGSIRVPMHNPEAAVKEIHRWADDPRFVQVLAFHSYSPGFGHPQYEPIWRAAAECGLPVASHASNSGVGANTGAYSNPVGSGSFFFDWHSTGYAYTYIGHLASMICNGVFERYPDLKMIVIEAGVSWSLPMGDHLDRNWKRLRSELFELPEPPSFYLNRNVLFSTQPIEEPGAEMLTFAYDQLHADRRLVFATDYPHWDFDDPARALTPLPKELRKRILGETARDLYGLPAERWEPTATVAAL
jgi:predicted TIM-barrel fold metal-dependent hydrolase